MIISRRLENIIEMIRPCDTLADIGCDHGYVSIKAVKSGKARHAIAADVAEGPLSAAKRNAEAAGTFHSTEFILSDGLKAFNDSDKIECIVIAGMGGILIAQILRSAGLKRFRNLKQIILGPQSDLDIVRRLLIDDLGYSIRTERCVSDDGKYYFLMDVIPGQKNSSADIYEDFEYVYGKNISAYTSGVYLDYLNFRLKKFREAFINAAKGSGEDNIKKLAGLENNIKFLEKSIIKAGGSV